MLEVCIRMCGAETWETLNLPEDCRDPKLIEETFQRDFTNDEDSPHHVRGGMSVVGRRIAKGDGLLLMELEFDVCSGSSIATFIVGVV